MAGINLTGLPNTNDYVLGRGRVSAAFITESTGLPGPYRDLGNSPEFSMSIETEKLEHLSSRQGLKVVDKEVLISQKINLTLSLDEINFQNLALFLSGDADPSITNLGTSTNAAGVVFVTLPTPYVASGVLGHWFDLIDAATGARVYNIDEAATLGTAAGGNEIQLFIGGIAGTEFTAGQYLETTLDRKHGRIFLSSDWPPGVQLAAGGVTLAAKWAAAISTVAPVVEEVRGATQTNIKVAIKFIAVNPANDNEETEYQFHQVNLKPQGDFPLIGDEFARMQFTGACEANILADANSPYVTIRRGQ